MREGGVLKLARVSVFPIRSTHGTIAAPPVGEIYRAKYIFRWISVQLPACYQTAEHGVSRFSNFSVKGEQILEQNAQPALSVEREIF